MIIKEQGREIAALVTIMHGERVMRSPLMQTLIQSALDKELRRHGVRSVVQDKDIRRDNGAAEFMGYGVK